MSTKFGETGVATPIFWAIIIFTQEFCDTSHLSIGSSISKNVIQCNFYTVQGKNQKSSNMMSLGGGGWHRLLKIQMRSIVAKQDRGMEI